MQPLQMLKLKQMGTHGVHLRGFPSLAGPVGPVQENIFPTGQNCRLPPSTQASWWVSTPVSVRFCLREQHPLSGIESESMLFPDLGYFI